MARNTILIVDDEELDVDLIRLLFKDEYNVMSCSNGKEALSFLTQNYKNIAIVLLDLVMPTVDGRVLLKVLNSKGITKIIPVAIVTADSTPERITECYENGAVDYITKPFISSVVKGRIKNLIELYNSKIDLEVLVNQQTSKIKKQNQELMGLNNKIVDVMSNIVEFRNLESGMHIKRIKAFSGLLAEMVKQMYPDVYHLTDKDVAIIENASALHDIGKIAISDTILLKAGRLSTDEFEVIKSHTTQGCEVLGMLGTLQNEKQMKVSYNIVRHHHERYDGKGYPDGLSGEDIPIEAQIVSIADAYEALIGERIYREAYDKDTAFSMIVNGECGAFSDMILQSFKKVRPLLEKESDRLSEEE